MGERRSRRNQSQLPFKFYIHDGVQGFRLQLIGELASAHIPELEGCWATARSMVGRRPLILDLHALKSADASGREWLLKMVREGAECQPDTYFRAHLVESNVTYSDVATQPTAKSGRLASWWRGSRDLGAEPSTRVR